jgi:hypothetical protein
MINVISLDSRRKSAPVKPTVQQVIEFCVEDILDHWEKFASNNRLNDYFIASVPSWTNQSINYLEDLTAVSIIEQKIDLPVQVVAPGFGSAEDPFPGWIASFRLNGEIITTPFMVSEVYARCFNIMLYLKIRRELVSNDLV